MPKPTSEEITIETEIRVTGPIVTGVSTNVALLQTYCRENYKAAEVAIAKLIKARERIRVLKELFLEARREHYHCDDSHYCCNQCDAADHGGEAIRGDEACNCGASIWNQKLDEILKI